MHHRSVISLSKLLCKHSSRRCSVPAASFPFTSLKTSSNQCGSGLVSSPKHNGILYFLHQTNLLSLTQFSQNTRQYSVDSSEEVDRINLKFVEAREEIDLALESRETVYFDEEAECARAAVKEVVDMYKGLLAKLPESEKGALQRSMGLKIEQLKAEVEQLND